ncbi:hypothetical protein GGS23DRAFT_550100 [Durotheca rogersii]|uniref:uncharacterized protein n=1 Tax=Durotheca rogersii TaxID=419775 RepID=UPI00221FC5C7|nr:uncharacterized protein GGS23DRAFT_550100 [Durotheca rogersii]KAI5867811.1 hypothetical protein GGS23DRAFT_550100 [Durotheca rogersii]
MMDAYADDTLAVVSPQNCNGYTGFPGASTDEYVEARERERESGADAWARVAQIALPSFPGRDEALFVFQRGAPAPGPRRRCRRPWYDYGRDGSRR